MAFPSRSLVVDTLKIDRSYVSGLTKNHKDAAIVAAIIALGHSLDMQIVAEGVETCEQRDMLCELGCDELQGFYLSQPVDAQVFAGMISKIAKN